MTTLESLDGSADGSNTIPSQPANATPGSFKGRNVVLWKQLVAAGVITALGADILVGGIALVYYTPSLRANNGGFIILGSSIVGLGGFAIGSFWIGVATSSSLERSRALKYLEEGEESYKNNYFKLETICSAGCMLFSKGELTAEEHNQINSARWLLQPFVKEELKKWSADSVFSRSMSIEAYQNTILSSGYKWWEDADEQIQAVFKGVSLPPSLRIYHEKYSK